MRRLPYLALRCCIALSVARVVSAQDAVTAISGNPAAIARIRAEFAAIERDAPRYRRTTHQLEGFSLEGGELEGFYDGAVLRKLVARQSGETWRGTDSYYFSDGRLRFIHVVRERYDRPMSGRVRTRSEQRFYLNGGRLIRRVRTQSPARTDEDDSEFGPAFAELLTNAKLFTGCAAAEGKEPKACSAPDR